MKEERILTDTEVRRRYKCSLHALFILKRKHKFWGVEPNIVKGMIKFVIDNKRDEFIMDWFYRNIYIYDIKIKMEGHHCHIVGK